jgi:hypothetical protein
MPAHRRRGHRRSEAAARGFKMPKRVHVVADLPQCDGQGAEETEVALINAASL